MTDTEQINLQERRDIEQGVERAAEPPGSKEDKIGLAFSGGGIRSAALSSGVLRRLLQRGVNADYISCVSGGNFTAASYVDWKYHNGNEDNHEWHKEYFEHMRQSVGYLCNWQEKWKGVLESLLLVFLLLFVNVGFPCAIWGSFSFPVAYLVDILFGDVMRVGFNCSQVNSSDEIITMCRGDFNSNHPDIHQPLILFSFLIITYIVLFMMTDLVPASQRYKVAFLDFVTGMVLAFVFLPWLIQQLYDVVPWYLYVIILLFSVFFWLGFPLLRKKASFALVAYFYAFVTRWRVYKGVVFFLPYTERTFFTVLLVAGVLIWASPFLGMLSNTAIFTFFKWRLQKAFFHKNSSGSFGCKGISCRDFFPVMSFLHRCSVHRDYSSPASAALTMDDIKDVKPLYISNVTVDYWKRFPEKPPYGLISISPKEVERIDRQPGEAYELGPKNIKVADAMTISASIMSPTEANNEPFRDLQILLGLAIRKHTRSDRTEGNTGLGNKILAFILQSVVSLPLVLLAVFFFTGWDTRQAEVYTMIVFGVYVVFFLAIASSPENEKCWRRLYDFVRWCHIHLYHVRFLRELLRITKRGADPPALLALSDAGRLEKYGLIPLLKRKLPKIVIVDGSFIRADKLYAEYLLKSLKLAREELGCEFVGYGGRDVLGEIEKKYVQQGQKRHQRSYKFIVRYFDSNDRSAEVGRGEILIIAPRHPGKGVDLVPSDLDSTWNQFTKDTGQQLDEDKWGSGFVLEADKVDQLTFCCCECCHSSSSCIRKASHALCLGFPSHSTANQFFTPSQFTAYHREGYRACVEAGVEEFLNDSTSVTIKAEPLTL